MKKSMFYLYALLALFSFASCTKDHLQESDMKKEVKITASIVEVSSLGNTTRASNNQWDEGDAIGVFMKKAGSSLNGTDLATNVKFTNTIESAFTCDPTNKIYFPFNKEAVDFIAYYPYQPLTDVLTYQVDVSSQSDISAIDLMYSNNVTNVNSTAASVGLQFEHQLTKVVLNINQNNTGVDLTGLTAKITNLKTKALFSLVDGTLSTSTDVADVVFNFNSTTNTPSAILLPETDLSNKSIVITLGGVNYSYPLSNSTEITSFDKSVKCEYNITLQAGQGPLLEGVTATIKDWTTVSDDIVVEEQPADTPSDPDTNPEDGDDTTEGNQEEGDGTKENPYTITQALQMEPVTGVWIKGYVVGAYKEKKIESFVNDDSSGLAHTLALAQTSQEAGYKKILPIDLIETAFDSSKSLQLKYNKSIFKKEIFLRGDLGDIFYGGVFGLKKIDVAIIDGVEIK